MPHALRRDLTVTQRNLSRMVWLTAATIAMELPAAVVLKQRNYAAGLTV